MPTLASGPLEDPFQVGGVDFEELRKESPIRVTGSTPVSLLGQVPEPSHEVTAHTGSVLVELTVESRDGAPRGRSTCDEHSVIRLRRSFRNHPRLS